MTFMTLSKLMNHANMSGMKLSLNYAASSFQIPPAAETAVLFSTPLSPVAFCRALKLWQLIINKCKTEKVLNEFPLG